MNRFLIRTFLLVLLFSGLFDLYFAQGDDGWQALRRRYLGLKSLAGSFVETVELPEAGQEPIVFKGNFVFKLPDKFRVEVTEPVRQLIVGNDSVVWFYFPDEQRAVLQTGSKPVPLLAFLAPVLDSGVTVIDEGGGVIAVVADKSGYLNDLRLELEENRTKIRAFSFVDEWGNRYRFLLLNQRWNPVVPEGRFVFVPPKGTTVDYY